MYLLNGKNKNCNERQIKMLSFFISKPFCFKRWWVLFKKNGRKKVV